MIKQDKYTMYQNEYDVTFIMVDTWEDDEIISTECVGWYYGKPNKEDNELFVGKLKGTYEWRKQTMKERILTTLEAYLITNRDVMEEDHIKDVEEQIETAKHMNENFFKLT